MLKKKVQKTREIQNAKRSKNKTKNILRVHALCITEHNLSVSDTLLPRSAKSLSLKFQIPVGKSHS